MERFFRPLFFLLLAFYVCGCSPAKLRATDERLVAYVELFKAEAFKRGVVLPDLNYIKVVIVPAADAPGLHGLCRSEEGVGANLMPIKRKTVYISDAAYNRSEFATMVTVFHELSHCFLGTAHREDKTHVFIHESGISYTGEMPVSIMVPSYFNSNQEPVAELYWDLYVDELFGVIANPFY